MSWSCAPARFSGPAKVYPGCLSGRFSELCFISICLVWRRVAKGGVRPLVIIEVHAVIGHALGDKAVDDGLQDDGLFFTVRHRRLMSRRQAKPACCS